MENSIQENEIETSDSTNTNENENKTIKELEVTAKQIVDRISIGSLSKKENEELSKQLNSVAGQDQENKQNEEETKDEFPLLEDEEGRPIEIVEPPIDNIIPEPVRQMFKLDPNDGETEIKQFQKWIDEAHKESGLSEGASREEESAVLGLEKFHWIFSIESYIRTMDWTSQNYLAKKFSTELVSFLKKLFHFRVANEDEFEYNCVFPHWNIQSGLQNIAQWNLHVNFPKLFTNGFEHFIEESSRLPVIYCPQDTVGLQIASKLGLPYSCISSIDFMDDDWVTVLEQKILADVRRGYVPVMLMINSSGVKDIEKGWKMAQSYKIWVHFYGTNVLSYFISRPEADQIFHSLTLDLSRWLKTPSLPYLTLYKRPPKFNMALLEFCELENLNTEISCFSSWFISSAIGVDTLNQLFETIHGQGQFLLQLLQRYSSLYIVPSWIVLSDDNVILSSITFQYNPPNFKRKEKPEILNPEQEQEESLEYTPSTEYVDTVNSWLFHILEHDLKGLLSLEFFTEETNGWQIHIDLSRCPRINPIEETSIETTFDRHMNVLESTVSQKSEFKRIVNENEYVQWVDHEDVWAGLGAVRYIPRFHRLKDRESGGNQFEQQASLDIKENIDHLNKKIVDKLRKIDTAFSLGEALNGDWVVQFGMVTEGTEIKELLRLVISTGEEIEDSKEFLDRMTELVKKGIEKATEELRKETEEALWEEGLLRRVPLVGTFVNWWSPPVKESGVRGRALNLTQGSVESTELIYKYHMQMQVDSPSPSTSASASNKE